MNIKRKKNSGGFTLIEIIAVVIIIGILAIVTVPSVSRYIANTRKTAYSSHEESMKRAAESYTIECLDGTNPNCLLPDRGTKQKLYLNELVDKGYLDNLKSTDGKTFCDKNLSYVEIANTGKSNYEYTVCLYCGDYSTDNSSCTKY